MTHVSSLYTKTQNNIGDKLKYQRSVERALVGNSKKEWKLSEVIEDVSDYVEKRLKSLMREYSNRIKNKKSEEIELKEFKFKEAALECYESLVEEERDDILKCSMARASRASHGLKISKNNPMVKGYIVREVVQRGHMKDKK